MSSLIQRGLLLLPFLALLIPSVDSATTLKLSRHPTDQQSAAVQAVERRSANHAKRALHMPLHSHDHIGTHRAGKRRLPLHDVFTSHEGVLGAVDDVAVVTEWITTTMMTAPAASQSASSTSASSPPVGQDPDDLRLANTAGMAYSIDVEIDGVSIPVIVDTGSSLFWMPAASCATCQQSHMTVSHIDPGAGCDYANQTYGMGSVGGCLTRSSISVGPYQVRDVDMLAATVVDEVLQGSGEYLSGIMGLAGENTPSGSPTVIKAMYDQGLIKYQTVGFFLSSDPAIDSEITFGDVETSEHADATQKVTLPSVANDNDLYEVIMDSFNINDQPVATSQHVFIDTGSSYIFVPDQAAQEIYARLPDVKQSKDTTLIPCSPVNPPGLSLQLGGMLFDLPYKYIVGQESTETPGYCVSKISALLDMEIWILGDAFLHTVYTSFDVGTKEVTLYKLK
ncbi:hypothetical protein IAU60_004608 [Kwoniella sp. DSM 27419]